MVGPRYRFFKDIAYLVACEFCETCKVEWCDEYGKPKKKCPHPSKWKAIYDDLDQVISRASEIKEAV